ncbi:hypothetical protein A2696_01265 [Candidatus Curtissbacteria bacterium RIFCSPHIGHO2_01_FULL_41_13]|uniref:GPI inositol-deacylase PGAP1-like alpha/beta domain-containing protein n=1 Tax=Candidatus Curtissbacteria bacterium RIFCSPHIGHO2_01_FULL_41_13 TaxID=1797745 RepID=A0A1F5G055_9BACT|nr:MAG: hypothetical protein A2696_01265 [Candidatus Curtissbacteria bacterium RIFCSPHIGHO2_01_FULL_41_13]
MNQEALSGLGFEGAATYSPRVEQETVAQSKNRFPKSRSSFFGYLVRRPLDYLPDSLNFVFDLVQASLEWQILQLSPIYRGEEAPHGEGVVVIVPGFGTAEVNYGSTAVTLKNLGYEPKVYPLKFVVNAEPVSKMLTDYVAYLVKQKERSGRKIHVLGHSKGGLVTLAALLRFPEEFNDSVDQVVFLGSPKPEWLNSYVGGLYLFTQYLFGGDDFKFSSESLDGMDVENIDGVRITSIANPGDQVIRGQLVGSPEDHFLVKSSHAGHLVCANDLGIVANRLSRPLAA